MLSRCVIYFTAISYRVARFTPFQIPRTPVWHGLVMTLTCRNQTHNLEGANCNAKNSTILVQKGWHEFQLIRKSKSQTYVLKHV